MDIPSIDELLREWEIFSRVIDYYWRDFQRRIPTIPTSLSSLVMVAVTGWLILYLRSKFLRR